MATNLSEIRRLAGLERRNLDDLEEDYGTALRLAGKALQKVRPTGSRDSTLKAIAKALAGDKTLMDLLANQIAKHGDYHVWGDMFGDPVMKWKEAHQIEDDDEYEELSLDLKPYMAPYLKKHKASPVTGGAPNYMSAGMKAKKLVTVLKELERGTEQDEEKSKTLATKLVGDILAILQK